MSDNEIIVPELVLPEFPAFPKIPRLNREVVVSEKIDGTNAVIWVNDEGNKLHAGSRSRWITPESDNFGFARWVKENETELLKLGPGCHYGEWWGAGVGRRYNQKQKHFSLFNTERWATSRPSCCGVVPVLARGALDLVVPLAVEKLRKEGSVAAPGFMDPEGVIVWHTAAQIYLKVTLKNDEKRKSEE